MAVVKLTEALIKNYKFSDGIRKVELRDQDLPGFLLELRASSPGQGTWALRYRNADGKDRCWKVGTMPAMNLSTARAAAKQKKAEVQLGADPNQAKDDQKVVPLLKTFVYEQYLPYVRLRKRSYADDVSRLEHHILPRFGERKINSLTKKEVVDMHNDLRNSGLAPATADRVLSLLRYLLNLSVEWGVISTNPASKVPLFLAPNQKERYLSDAELSRLLVVLQTEPNRPVARLFLFLLSTGSRLNEGLTATWEQIDLQHTTWRIPATTAKAKRTRAVPLNETAMEVLLEQQPDANLRTGRVFVKDAGEPIKSVQRPWERIRAAAGVPDLRIHDMRHSFASMLANSGRTLYEIQRCLGHSSANLTARYSHLSTSTLQDASASASNRMKAVMPRLLPSPSSPPSPTPDATSPASAT